MATRLRKLKIGKVALVARGANQLAEVLLYKAADMQKATWTTALINTFPDASFAYVESGDKDSEGKTTPRSKRHLPYKDADGKLDAAHVRNALARLDQTQIPATAKASARRKLEAAAKTLQIEVGKQEMGMNGDEGDGDEPPPMTLEERQQSRQLWQQWNPLWWDFCATVNEIMDGDDDDPTYAPILMQSIEQFRTQASDLLTGLGLVAKAAPLFTTCDDVRKAGAVLSAANKKRLQDALTALQAVLDAASPATDTPTRKGARMAETIEGITKRAEIAEARVKALEAEIAKRDMTPEQQEAEFLKSLPESVRKRWQDDQVEKAALKEAVAVEKEAREQTEYIAKTASYPLVGLVKDDWALLRAVEKREPLTEAQSTRLLQVLKSANELIRQGKAFAVIGKGGGGAAGDSAEAKALAFAKAEQEKDPKLSFAEAMTKVWKDHGDLYEQYNLEKRRQGRVA